MDAEREIFSAFFRCLFPGCADFGCETISDVPDAEVGKLGVVPLARVGFKGESCPEGKSLDGAGVAFAVFLKIPMVAMILSPFVSGGRPMQPRLRRTIEQPGRERVIGFCFARNARLKRRGKSVN